MSEFKIIISDNQPDPNSAEEIVLYKKGIEDILTRLEKRLTENTNNSDQDDSPKQPLLPTSRSKLALDTVHDLLESLKNDTDIFADDYIDIQKHPSLWSKTGRIGQSKIVFDGSSNKPSTYEALNKKLLQRLRKLSPFNRIERKNRKEINLALDELKQWQTDVMTAYIVRLRNMTAEKLLSELSTVSSSNQSILNEKQRLETQIREIKKLTSNDLRTSTQCLEYTKKVNTLRNDLLRFNNPELFRLNNLIKNSHIQLNDFDHLAKQLGVVTKRWIDPFYEHPKELTKIEWARKIAKMVIINIAEVLAVTAFILFFVFPPASFPVGVAASIGMLPILDGFFEVARNIWYGRTPTKSQVMELGIAVALVAGLTFLAYGVAAIGSAIVQYAPQVAKQMIEFGTLMSTIFMRFIDVVLNTAGSILDAILFKKTLEPKTEKQLAKSKPPTLKKAMQVFHDELHGENGDLRLKMAAIKAPEVLERKLKKDKKCSGLYYVYKKDKDTGAAASKKGFFSFPFALQPAGANKKVKTVVNAIPGSAGNAYLFRR